MYSKLIEVLSGSSQVFFDESMKKHTTFKIGGNADCFVVVNSDEDLINVINHPPLLRKLSWIVRDTVQAQKLLKAKDLQQCI